MPPAELTGLDGALVPGFRAAPELLDWAIATFIDEEGALHNPDHAHLMAARLGFLWTSAGNSRHGKKVIGQAEFKPPGGSMGKWARARAQAQLHDWFGQELDFLVTIYAPYAFVCTDTEFCALVEHELYHCGQAQDEFGAPRFLKDSGIPVFAMRGHDVEEFAGVVRRYGPTNEVAALIEAVHEGPTIDTAEIRACCGTCKA